MIMSGEGSGYVPAGVFVPRTVRLLVADGLVDRAFRNTWFGCVDPARVLVEYARMRAATGWELVAAATSDQSSSLRQCGVEHVESYAFPMSVAEIPLPVLDGMHVHRLQLEFPDLFERLTNLSAADDASARRMMMVLARDLIDEVNGFQHLIDLPRTWSALVAGNEPSADEWDKFQKLTELEFLVTTTKRPPACPVEVYRQAWMVGRAMEVVSGFGDRPLPLPDMVYALSAAWPGVDVRRQVEPLLRAAELDLGWY
ncbi:hypothetical protein AWC17_29960 [Mycobacterium nebraskense]|uniref:Uncharacterized protein n=2 Tax=Mycobacterium nebraskense TaxID=244292 RepID=A0A1X1ZTL5_9MYCO|nr:hypothetical protein AWC17_29960 [Mycobacterium nebraskense]